MICPLHGPILKENLGVVESVSEKGKYTYKIDIDKIKLPINKGTTVGKIDVLENGKVVSTGELVIDQTIAPLKFFELFKKGLVDLVSGNL